VWKRLKHRNIVPFLGITSDSLQLVSEWMPGGNLAEHVRNHPDADRRGFVGVSGVVLDPTLTPAISYPVLLRAFIISTPVT